MSVGLARVVERTERSDDSVPDGFSFNTAADAPPSKATRDALRRSGDPPLWVEILRRFERGDAVLKLVDGAHVVLVLVLVLFC